MVRHTGEDFIDEECIAEATVLSFQSAGINCTEFDAPEPDRFAGDSDASFGEKIFDITMAEVESVVQPDGVGNDIRRESVAFINSHGPSLPISGS